MMLRATGVTIALLLALQQSPQEFMVRRLAEAQGIDPNYAACIVARESEWNTNAVGDDGAAVGLWQWHLGSWQHVREAMGLPVADRRADPVESTVTALWWIGQGYGRWWTADRYCHDKEYTMAKTSRVFQQVQDLHDDDTALERRLVGELDAFRQLVWQRAGDGEITPAELSEINDGIQELRAKVTRSLDNNRVVASLLCCEAGRLDPQAEKTQERLPALRLLATPEPEPEEDWAA